MVNLGNVMHIDTSAKLYERKHTGIAFKLVSDGSHKGLALRIQLKKELEKNLEANHDYARIYAICIYYLIKDDLNNFDTLVICGDECFLYVKRYLDVLFSDCPEYFKKNVISIGDLRKILGDNNLRSKANNIANSYRKRALRTTHRQQKGIPLNVVRTNYTAVETKWIEIEEKLSSFTD
ncbi:MAG: hypothetical protein KKA79_03470 [Nanoarchaeota archaeon]|nr:hypothetical protein [Nanoarchaeota archaeon]